MKIKQTKSKGVMQAYAGATISCLRVGSLQLGSWCLNRLEFWIFSKKNQQFLKLKTLKTYWDCVLCVLACWLAQSRAKKAFQTSSQKVRKSQKCEVRNKNHGNNALPLHHCMLKWHSLLPGDPPLKVATLSGEIWEMVSGRAVLKSHEG